jgi:hypothetical protein
MESRAVGEGDSGLVGGILVYVVTPESCTKYTRENPPPPSLSLPHRIGSVPVTPGSDRSARGAPGQGVSTYGIWPAPGSPAECRPLERRGHAKRTDGMEGG